MEDRMMLAYLKSMDAALERCDALGKMLEASVRGEGVMVRVIGDDISVERVELFSPTDTKEG